MPEEFGSPVQGSQAAPAPPPEPQSVTSASTSAAGSPSPTPSPSQGQAGQQAPQGTPTDVLGMLRQYGVEGNFNDPAQALQALASTYRQAGDLRQLAQHGQEYLRHQSQFQEWQRERAEAEARKQAASQQWFKAPEYDPTWLSKVYRDPQSGEIRSLPGSDPSIPQKLAAWNEHQRGFIDKFAQDPMKAIQPGLEQLIDQRAQQLIQQQLGGYREQVQAREILGQHASWIYEQNAQGGKQLSAQGQNYARYVQQAQQQGITTSQGQHDYALGFVQRDYLLAQMQGQAQGTPQAQGDQAKERFLAQAAGGQHRPGAAPQAGQATPNGAPGAGQVQANGQRGLEDLLMRNLNANGYQPGQAINRR